MEEVHKTMEEEFNLSKKRERTTTQSNDTTISNCFYLYNEKDVKELIKRLKEDLRGRFEYNGHLIAWERIDKLVGEKLK